MLLETDPDLRPDRFPVVVTLQVIYIEVWHLQTLGQSL